jgi:hypothetical protein
MMIGYQAKKWNMTIVGELLSYAGIDFKKPIDEE